MKIPASDHKVENTIWSERTSGVLSIQRENGNGTETSRKKRHLQINKSKKERNTCGRPGACIPMDDSTKGRGFNERIKTKTKQNKTKVTPEKDFMTSANKTPGGYEFAPLMASQQGRANQHDPACFGLSSSWSFTSRSGIRLHAVVQSWLPPQRSISP